MKMISYWVKGFVNDNGELKTIFFTEIYVIKFDLF